MTGEGGAEEVALLGGMDTARSRRDGDGHPRGPAGAAPRRGVRPTPAWYDVQLQVPRPAGAAIRRCGWNEAATPLPAADAGPHIRCHAEPPRLASPV